MPISQDSTESLRQVAIFADLPEQSLERIAQLSPPRRYPKGQILCLEGDPGIGLYLLEEGRIKVTQVLPSGDEAVLGSIEAPAALGELSLLDDEPRSANLTAATPIVVRTITRNDFHVLLRDEPQIAPALLRNLSGIIRRSNQRQIDLLALDVPGRLAKWLLQQGSSSFKLGRSQSELAAELGTTRSTLNRALSGFVDFDLIEFDGETVRILRPDRLQEYTG